MKVVFDESGFYPWASCHFCQLPLGPVATWAKCYLGQMLLATQAKCFLGHLLLRPNAAEASYFNNDQKNYNYCKNFDKNYFTIIIVQLLRKFSFAM